MIAFTTDMSRKNGSPDRCDALVWAVSELMVEVTPGAGILEHYRREVEKIGAINDRDSGDPLIRAGILKPKADDGARVRLRVPAGISTVFGGETGTMYQANGNGTIDMLPKDADHMSLKAWERVIDA